MVRFIKDERGVETLEFLGIFPLVLLIMVLIWQFVLAGYTAVVVAGASREAARAAAVQADCHSAAASASLAWNDGTRQVNCWCSGDTCTAVVQLQIKRAPLPLIGGLPNYPWVSSTAVMRYEPPYH